MKRKSFFNSPEAFVLIAALTGGSTPVIAKVALGVFPPFLLLFIRFISATVMLLPVIMKRNELSYGNFKTLLPVALLGAVNPVLLFIALPMTTASVSPVIYAIVPSLTAVYLYIAERQSLTKRQTSGIVLGFIGVLFIALMPILEHAKTDYRAMYGNLLILLGSAGFMFYGVYSKRLQKKLNISPISLTFYFCLITMLGTLPFAYRDFAQDPYMFQRATIFQYLSAFGTGIIGTSLFYLIYQYTLKIGNPFTASLFIYIQPIVTIILSVLLLSERITPAFVFGSALAVVGAQLASKKPRRIG